MSSKTENADKVLHEKADAGSIKNQGYYGGKSGAGTYQTIINQIPRHDVRVSLFGGMLGVERMLLPCKTEHVFELDSDLIKIHEKEYGFHYYNKNLEYIQALLINSPYSQKKRCYQVDSIAVIGNSDVVDSLDQSNVFIYADPPYPMCSRKSDRKVYKHELTDEDHWNFLQNISHFYEAKVAISTYPNPIYDEFFTELLLFPEWRKIEFQSNTRHGMATEQLWMNYPQPDELHDYRYLGDTFHDRQDFKRLMARWGKKFDKLTPHQQKAMLDQLKNR